ncbi:unnamed protein product [Rotaria sordida]|uniref:CRAL-TRIO domain-containing protein n=2 Tax=Rotaria sordida TaxID=392033 RepID=A0A814AN64_9BILA|nr:unnamed protein product [Rotaria sordida]
MNKSILRPTSKDYSDIDPDEENGVISCMIENNQVNIDVKTISPFKCIFGSAGKLQEDHQTAIIVIYGCWLPDRRLREYRYIMDQLFYYIYHKLEKLVTNDYVLIYFHGATPKHRTPELKILRKYYQMINFRLRKNLRAIYVVHPTRWLRAVIALSRPFFSNKFYHKVHYLFTISELEREFPHNPVPIPIIIEHWRTSFVKNFFLRNLYSDLIYDIRESDFFDFVVNISITDWLYSQKYDRQNASIKRSIERSTSQQFGGHGHESAA